MNEPIVLEFELNRKQMISANDRLHFQKKAKLTHFLRELAKYEGLNTLKDYFGLPFSEEKPCFVQVLIFRKRQGFMTLRTGHQPVRLCWTV